MLDWLNLEKHTFKMYILLTVGATLLAIFDGALVAPMVVMWSMFFAGWSLVDFTKILLGSANWDQFKWWNHPVVLIFVATNLLMLAFVLTGRYDWQWALVITYNSFFLFLALVSSIYYITNQVKRKMGNKDRS